MNLTNHHLLALLLVGLSAGNCGNCGGDIPKPLKAHRPASSEIRKTARLIHTEGQVRIKRSGQSQWVDAQPGASIGIQDKIRTMRRSFATIEFEEGGILRVEPESLMAVTDLHHQPRDQIRRSTFTLEAGKVEAELHPLESEQSEFRILTGGAEASVLKREVEFQ